MASNLIAMASNVLAMASSLEAMASSLIVVVTQGLLVQLLQIEQGGIREDAMRRW